MNKNLKLGIICGGPSEERGISINSTRSVCDHMPNGIEVVIFYINKFKKFYIISKKLLYSNTPSDFDFKLNESLEDRDLKDKLRECDLVFPLVHGKFGEDGALQKKLEKLGCKYIGARESICRRIFDKYSAYKNLSMNTLPHALVNKKEDVENFFYRVRPEKVVIKPRCCGSSFGVKIARNKKEAVEKFKELCEEMPNERVMIEEYCKGKEFTLIVLEKDKEIIPLIPTEIEKQSEYYGYREKYLPTTNTGLYTPPRFDDHITRQIRDCAKNLLEKEKECFDFLRIDGWVLGDQVYFSDFNPISGMEQNSFLFIQAAQVGMSHTKVLKHIIDNASRRELQREIGDTPDNKKQERRNIQILFGGASSERQVSVMSGTNVWLKLLHSKKYLPLPYVLDIKDEKVWQVPYSLCLYHTVEEIVQKCEKYNELSQKSQELIALIQKQIGAKYLDIKEKKPHCLPLQEFIDQSSFVFIALHGGIGENGEIQKRLENARKPFTGPDSESCKICMDKYLTFTTISNEYTIPKKRFRTTKLNEILWEQISEDLGSQIVVKPNDDGCSTGVAILKSQEDFQKYQKYLNSLEPIPKDTLLCQKNIIEMPKSKPEYLIFEKYIPTVKFRLSQNSQKSILRFDTDFEWVEITIGIYGIKNNLTVLNPSITVAENEVLSLEEKFQGGTGINITPLPEKIDGISFVTQGDIDTIKRKIKEISTSLKISGFARIDAFFNIKSKKLVIIEANAIPGLTPSTVLYHQALEEIPPLFPIDFLEKIIICAEERHYEKND